MDSLTPSERSDRMRLVKSADTKPEIKLRQIVWSMGYRYRKNRKDIFGRPDLAFIGRKRVIFLHGCFWHRHDCNSGRRVPKSNVVFWENKFEQNVRRDVAVMKKLEEEGWQVLVIWECELANRAQVERKVSGFIDA